jgi:hypothetical protein
MGEGETINSSSLNRSQARNEKYPTVPRGTPQRELSAGLTDAPVFGTANNVASSWLATPQAPYISLEGREVRVESHRWVTTPE